MNHPRLKKLPLPVCLDGFVRSATCRKKAIAPVLHHLLQDDSGQDLIEYAMVAALVGLGTIVALRALSNSIGNSFNKIGSSLTNNV